MATKSKAMEASVEDAVSTAFSDMESIKDELQEWYDNLPESFQNGSKGEALQEAVSTIENAIDAPNVPDCVSDLSCSYQEYMGKIGRPKRRDTCVNMLNAAVDAARERGDELAAMDFSEPEEAEEKDPDAEEKPDAEEPDTDEVEGDDPKTEEDRDTMVDEIDSFIDECENAVSEWENVEFPGMYG